MVVEEAHRHGDSQRLMRFHCCSSGCAFIIHFSPIKANVWQYVYFFSIEDRPSERKSADVLMPEGDADAQNLNDDFKAALTTRHFTAWPSEDARTGTPCPPYEARGPSSAYSDDIALAHDGHVAYYTTTFQPFQIPIARR